MIYGITLIILGILAVPSLLLSKRPDAKEVLDQIKPYQGWLGLAFCVWGIIGVVRILLNIGIFSAIPVWWITVFAASALLALLGFILGYGKINELVLSKNDDAKEKGEQLLAKLTPIQSKLGLAAIAVGIWVIISHFIYMAS